MQIDELAYSFKKAIAAVAGRRHRLIVVSHPVGIQQHDLDNMGCAIINLNLLLSAKLKDMAETLRDRAATKCIEDILRQYTTEKILLFSRFEILFLPELQIDPVRLFEAISKEQTIILLWPGTYDGGVLSYAEPWHREYREYASLDAVII